MLKTTTQYDPKRQNSRRETSKVTDSGKETIIDTRTEKEKQLDSDWETEQ